VPPSLQDLSSVHHVRAVSAPMREWQLAYNALYSGAKEIGTGRGFVFPEPYAGDRGQDPIDPWAPRDPTAHLRILDGRIIAAFISRLLWKSDCHESIRDTIQDPHPAIILAFVCNKYRRQGIGKDLVATIAQWRGIAVTEMLWLGPYSESGLAFTTAVGGRRLG
jgi:GNAT superfamily N-acetyltransferase